MNSFKLCALVLAILTLGGCFGGSDFSDLQSFVSEVRARPKGKIEPIPVFKPYEPFTYAAAAKRSPFQPPIRVVMDERLKGSKDIKPDETRVKQFLEGFSFDDFQMVGTLSRDGGVFGLIQGGGGVHRVQVGDYLGKNHGQITSIDAAELQVVEIVPDGEGGWLERPRTLALKERS